MVTVGLSLGVKTTWLGLGKDHVWVKNMYFNFIFRLYLLYFHSGAKALEWKLSWRNRRKQKAWWMDEEKGTRQEREREEISVYDTGYNQTLLIDQNSISNVACEEFPAKNCGSWTHLVAFSEYFSRWCFLPLMLSSITLTVPSRKKSAWWFVVLCRAAGGHTALCLAHSSP